MDFAISLCLAATALAFTSCDNFGGVLYSDYYQLYSGETTYIDGEELFNIPWYSENEFVAIAGDGMVQAQYVGSTIVSSGNLAFQVDVLPRYKTYIEPCMDWGVSQSYITSLYGYPYAGDSDMYIYATDNYKAPYMFFNFEYGRLISSAVICPTSINYELDAYLGERYVYLDTENGMDIYAHCFGSIADPYVDYVVGKKYNNSFGEYNIVLYMNANGRSRKASDYDMQPIVEKLNALDIKLD